MRTEESQGTIFINWFTVLINRILFSECVSHRHYNTTFNLTFAGERVDSFTNIVCGNHFLNLACLRIKDADLSCISISNMRNWVRHICTKRMSLSEILSVESFSNHIFHGLTAVFRFHEFFTCSAARFTSYKCLTRTGSCTGIR